MNLTPVDAGIGLRPYYEHAGITLYHGDCRKLLPMLGDQSVGLVLTDPPYGVGFQYGASYDDTDPAYRDWAIGVFGEMRRVGRLVMLTTGMRHLWLYPPATWVMCWAKPGSVRVSKLGGFSEWEPVLVYGKRRIYNDFRYLPDAANHLQGKSEHPCPKPLALGRWLVKEGSDPGAIVLDPFAGSGTYLVAAKELGRRAIGIEIEERYCEIIARRLAQEVLPLEVSV